MKKSLNWNQLKERWDKIAMYDTMAKKIFYRHYSLENALKTYIELLNIASKTAKNSINNLSDLRRQKSEELIRIHRLFNNVK